MRGAIRPGIDESALGDEKYTAAEDGTLTRVRAKELSDKPNIKDSEDDKVSVHSDDENREKALTPDSLVLDEQKPMLTPQ